jgi:signal transduction histidine kinase
MVNILDNALKFTEANGQVLIKAMENEEAITIMVRDNGQGIDPDDLPLISKSFTVAINPGRVLQGQVWA